MPQQDRFHISDWGTFAAEVKDGRFAGVRPFAQNADPSPLIHSMAEAIYDASRVIRPMIRKGGLYWRQL